MKGEECAFTASCGIDRTKSAEYNSLIMLDGDERESRVAGVGGLDVCVRRFEVDKEPMPALRASSRMRKWLSPVWTLNGVDVNQTATRSVADQSILEHLFLS